MTGNNTFSVLICTYKRPKMLKQSLHALIEETTDKPDQVVVVNGGGGETDRVVRSFMGRHGIEVKLIKTVNKNLAASRNVGLPHCTGDIIGMTDDDAEVFPDWVAEMKKLHHNHPEAGAIGGAVIGAASEESLISRLADVATFKSHPEPTYVRTLPGVNISYKREVIDQVGIQDESLFRGEDVDYNWRIKKLGYKIYYHPKIKVRHHHRPSLRQFLKQHYMYGRAYYLVRQKWPNMYCVYPHGLRCFRDFLKLGFFAIGTIYLPAKLIAKVGSMRDRLLGYPILLANQIAWKAGMLRQMKLSHDSLEKRDANV